MLDAKASNWVLEKFSSTPSGFDLLGTTKGYASFSRAFQDGTTVFYAASDDDGNREAGYGVYRGGKIVDRTPTATLSGTVYDDKNPSGLSFSKGGTIGGTFNALAFNTLWNKKGAGMVISATEPTDVETGMQWLDSTTAEVWIWDEDKWLQFPVGGGGGVGANVQIEEWPPEYAKVGDMWTDYGTTGELYIWDGRFWVSMTGDGGPKVIVGGGDENPDIELPENLVFDRVEDVDDFDKALARFISPDNTGKWGRIKTADVETDPDVTFRDAKGRFKPTKNYEGLTDQLKVNRFLAGEIERQDEAIEGVATKEYVDEADLNLQQQIDDIEIPSLEDYATKEFAEEVDLTSQMRDEALDGKIDQESNLNTVAHLKLEDQILRCYAWSQGDNEKLERKLTKVDEELQAQIDDLPTTEYVDSGDRALQGEIDQIALALETLLVQREHGQWKYVGFTGDTIPRNAGEFSLASDDLSASDNIITLNTTDLEGKTHGFGDVDVGDYIEVVDLDAPSNYVLFVVAKKPEGTGIVNVEVTLKDKGNNFLIGETCEIRFFAINEQQLDLADLDKRYVKKSGSTMTGALTLDNAELKVKDEEGTSFFRVRPDSDSAILKGSFEAESLKSDAIEQKTSAGVTYSGSMDNANNIVTNEWVTGKIGGADYVSKTGGDDMEGPLRVNAQDPSDGRGTSFIQALGIYSKSDGSALRLGTTRDRVYIGHNDTTFNGPVKLEEIQSKKEGEGVPLSSEGTASDHLITKGYVDEADANLQSQIDEVSGGGGIDTSDFVQKSGDTMTGTLTVPRFEAKKTGGEAVCLIEGTVDGTGSSARLTFSNKINANAYGNFEWHGNNGSGWFQFNKDIDFSTKGLHSVNNIRLVGNKAIQESQTTRIKFDGKVIIPRTGDGKDGFAIKGRTAEGNNGDLLSAYHNSSGLDAINYRGKQGSPDNLATCGYVDSKAGASKGALISHMERLYKKGNGTDGKTFYFQNQYGSPSSGMNEFRKFKWKLPDSHYLMPMVGAGRNMGYIVVTNMSGQLQYQCQVSNADKTGYYITLELDHENRYGSNMMGDDSWYIVHLFSFLREA